MFTACFERFADRPCLSDRQQTLSYAETLALGRRIIAGLPPVRSLVLLRCSLTVEAIAAYIALLDAGHVPLLLEADLAPELVERLAAQYRVDAVLDPLGELLLREGGTPLHPDLALLLTTSGSTGSPKLVRLSHHGVLANARAIAEALSIDADDRPLLHLPMSYSYGLSVIHSHLVQGACVCLTQRTVTEAGYFDDLAHHAATSIAGVAFHYTALRRLLAKIDAPALRTLTQAGGRLDPKLVSFFAEWAAGTGRQFVVMYGQTEAGPRIATLPPEHALAAPDAIGVPLPGIVVHLVDEDGAPVADGTAGEMIVESPGVMMGYAHGHADLAEGDVLHGKLATGDLAQRGPDGLLRIVGRRSRILKIYGLRVNIDEVEHALAALGHRTICFGSDDSLRILIEGEADAQAVRQQVVDLFSLPPRGIEVRAGPPLARAASGKLTAAALADGWDAADGAMT